MFFLDYRDVPVGSQTAYCDLIAPVGSAGDLQAYMGTSVPRSKESPLDLRP